MKIDIDIEKVTVNKVQFNRSTPNTKNSNKNEVQTASSGRNSNLSKKRAYIDAVVVSQIAQGFFQKAVLISSRLKSIASEALVSGRIKETELKNTLTGIRSSLNDIRNNHTPILQTLQNFMTMYQQTDAGTEININEELGSLDGFASELNTGQMPDLKKIDNINSSLINKESAVNSFYNRLTDGLPLSAGLYSDNESLPEIAANTADLITDSPQAALISQGNIDNEAVKSLL